MPWQQVYQHILRARPEFGRDPETEFVWLEEWTQDSGFEYHCSGTPYNTHFHNIVDEYVDERCTVYRGPEGLIMLPTQEYMRGYDASTQQKVVAPSARKDHVFVVSHVHVHPHKVSEFLVKAATLLPHCRAEAGNVYENLYRQQGFPGVDEGDECAFVWMVQLARPGPYGP